MFDLSDPESIRKAIRAVVGIARGLSPEIELAEQLLFEQLETLASRGHEFGLRRIEDRKKTFDKYIEVGFSEEQAMMFMLNAKVMLEQAIRNLAPDGRTKNSKAN